MNKEMELLPLPRDDRFWRPWFVFNFARWHSLAKMFICKKSCTLKHENDNKSEWEMLYIDIVECKVYVEWKISTS